MKTRYLVIEDFSTHDFYSVLSKKEYKEENPTKEIFFSGSVEKCNDWIIQNPHPESIDYGVYFDEQNDDIDLANSFFI